jgi:hypothetical protein
MDMRDKSTSIHNLIFNSLFISSTNKTLISKKRGGGNLWNPETAVGRVIAVGVGLPGLHLHAYTDHGMLLADVCMQCTFNKNNTTQK